MNWVGGARSRIKMRDELTKQKEYFERKRYQNKVSRLEKPASPRKRKLPVSTDLLSLQAASFSAKKFNTKDTSSPIIQKVTKVDLDQSHSSLLPFRRLDDVELPMSPGAPSKLLLQEANSSIIEETANSSCNSRPSSSFLMTQTHQVEKNRCLSPKYETAQEQTFSQMSQTLSNKLEIYPEKFNTNSRTSMRNQMVPKSTPYQTSQQYQPTETQEFEEKLPNQSFHKRAPENLFFEFLPQAMSTLKRPPLDEECTETSESRYYNESPMSTKTDKSYISSYQSTISQDEESLVPQYNPCSPATTASSPCWEAVSISSFDNLSTDNLERDGRHGSSKSATSTGGDDTPHQSDSSLTTFRQYYRKKLKRSNTQHPSNDPNVYDSGTPNFNLVDQGRIDLKCHEVISPILPTKENLLMQNPFKKNDPLSQNKDVLVIDCGKDLHEQHSHENQETYPASTISADICQSEKKAIQVMERKKRSKEQTVMLSSRTEVTGNQYIASLSPAIDLTSPSGTNTLIDIKDADLDLMRHVRKNDITVNNTTDKMATEWKAFLGGVTGTGGTEEEELMKTSDSSTELSQGSCSIDDDSSNRMNVTSQVLFEVMELDKKINHSLSNISCHGNTDEYEHQDKCVETFNSERHLDRLQEKWPAENSLKKDSSHDTKNEKNNVDIKESEGQSSKSNELQIEQIAMLSGIQRSKSNNSMIGVEPGTSEFYSVKSNHKTNEKAMSSEAKKLILSSDRENLINSISVAKNEKHASQSEAEKMDMCFTEADKGVMDGQVSDQHKELISENSSLQEPSGPHLDKQIQCQLIRNSNSNKQDAGIVISEPERSQSQAVVHTGTQTDLEPQIADVVDVGVQCLQSDEDVVELGVQCDMCQSIMVTRKRVQTVAGGRINGRENQAYGPIQNSDICCVS